MTIDIKNIAEMDRNAVLHPFTQLKDFASGKLGEPTIVETGKGIRIQDAHGKQLIDGFAGLYCVNVGYGRTEVAEAISRQAYRLAYYHSYAAHTTDELAILSDRLVRMAPGKMSKVFYGMSGSDANETQAKLVWYYNNLRGKPQKKKIISRERISRLQRRRRLDDRHEFLSRPHGPSTGRHPPYRRSASLLGRGSR